ncbi:TetR/AcrR family transcriptional regulator [Pseudalkalibacillus berkeleyi]|uniref:TetR/AcrR family transcriptional regulator n=1 Tax=Pseudalkalibacillus berkeleyi TaxID=1069813 RepID=A0ABS9H1X2_9BACL|nr:TetR/AcrR family transcriptional regulator [Pseudalkalibacillus berkeleyi]MCF6137783.1 TetR/AcrR family transcriptional regulator [Pseudalkalibacillus berkeleyi]
MPRVSENYKEEKREAILDSAAQCFAEKGFSETTVDDIAKASKTSKGSIYLYFKSKEEIFHKLNDRRTEKYFEIKEQLSEFKNATAKIDYLFQYFISGKMDDNTLNHIAVQFEFWIYATKAGRQQVFDDRVERFTTFITEIIEEGIESGEFREDVQVKEFSRLFWSTLDGIVLHLLFHKDITEHRSMLRLYEQMIFKYLQN